MCEVLPQIFSMVYDGWQEKLKVNKLNTHFNSNPIQLYVLSTFSKHKDHSAIQGKRTWYMDIENIKGI